MIQALRILFLVTLLILGNAFAQIPALPLPLNPDNTAEKPVDSRTIAIVDLPRRIVEESAFIQRVVQKSTSVIKTGAFEQELEIIRRNVDALGERIVSKDFETLPLSGLESLQRYLSFLDEKLRLLQEDLQTTTRPLSQDAGELAQRRKIWLDARQSSAELISPTLLNSIDELDKDFQQAANEASRPLSTLLNLNHETSVLRARIGNSLLAVRNQIASIDRKLWTFDTDNLFTAMQNTSQQDKGTIHAAMNSYAIQGDFIKAHDQAVRTKHIMLAVLALLTLPAFLYLSRWARKIIDRKPSLERYRTTLSRPVSAWLLLVIMCQLMVDFDGPMFRLRLLLAIAWLPVMRLQPKWIHENIGRWIYSTALFFVLSFFSQLITSFPLEYRVTLLVNGLLLLGTLSWLLYHLPANSNGQNSRKRFLTRSLIVAYMALMALAVLANILGSVQLAALLTEASLNSLYLMLFLFAVREFVRAYVYIHIKSRTKESQTRTQQASRLVEVAFTLFNLVLALIWLAGTLNSLRVLNPLKSQLYAVSDFAIEFGSISITIGGIFLFCVSVFLSFWIAKTIRSVLSEDVLPNMTLPRGVANSVSTMSYYFLLMLGLLVALTAAGFQLSQLALVVGALSVGIGFGLNTVINNFVCGLILMIERPIQPGDTVELSGTTGKVRDIGIRTTTLTTFDGADVMVPNGMLLAEKLTNWTLNNDRRRIEIPIGVAYGSDPRKVQSLLLTVASNTKGVSHEPLPVVLFKGFGESSLDFSVRAWTDNYDQAPGIRSEMAMTICEVMKESGIEIPFPQRDLHIRSSDPGLAKRESPLTELAQGPTPVQDSSS